MLKRNPDNLTEIVSYICDNCVKAMPGAPITKYYPDDHVNSGEPTHFCSDKCDLAFTKKLITKYGSYVSKAPEPVKSSSSWRSAGEQKRGLQKSRKAPTKRRNSPTKAKRERMEDNPEFGAY